MAGTNNKMVSKRSSRVYLDDTAHVDETVTYRSRRNSRQEDGVFVETMEATIKMASARESSKQADDLPVALLSSEMATMDSKVTMEDIKGKTAGRASQRDAAEFAKAYRALLPIPVASLTPAIVNPVAGTPGPHNFGVVVPGIYRSSYPKLQDYGFVQTLRLKTIVTLVQKEDEDSSSFATFMAENGIRHRVFDMKGTKKEAIPLATMKDILKEVLDQRNHPLLIHCNHGKHRTGCVVGVIRKVSGWNNPTIIGEYKAYAEPKSRECDIKYIEEFQSASFSSLWNKELRPRMRTRTFLRATFLTFFVLALFYLSGQTMPISKQKRIEVEV